MDGVYALVMDRTGSIWIVPIPDNIEESDFRNMVGKEPGLSVCGISYLATFSQLKRDNASGRRVRSLPLNGE
jgi:hypothetical protein